MAHFMVRYGEIGLKSESVRKEFEKILRSNIEAAFICHDHECRITSDRGHIYVKGAEGPCFKHIQRTFGVTSFSKVHVLRTDLDQICKMASTISSTKVGPGQSFAIRSRRTGQHPFSSQDVAVRAGQAILDDNEGRDIRVDLDGPDVEIFIEVRENRTYIYTGKVPGPGGMPLGSQGKVVALVSGMRSAVACWLLMKRGCRPIVMPVGEPGGPQEEAIRVLETWVPNGRLSKGPSLRSVDEASIENAMDFAWMKRTSALVIGEGDSMFNKRNLPIFYPLIGMTEAMIEEIRERICQGSTDPSFKRLVERP